MKYFNNFVRVIKLLLFLFICSLILTSINAYGQSWNLLGSGTNNDIYAMTVYNNTLVVSGTFTTAGGSAANRIAVWNGTSWSTLGTGFDNKVYSLIVFNGNLIAGGSFTTAGGASANRIAIWNGSSWSALGSGIDNGQVNALAIFNGDLIAGGTFTTVNGTTMDRIAKWNGSGWSVLSNVLGNEVDALVLYNGNLIVGGKFTSAGVPNTARIAMWNGTVWSALGTGIDNGQVYSLGIYNSNLIAGGSFSAIGGVTYNSIASWNGTAWSNLGTGVNGDVLALNIYLGDLYSGGAFTKAGGSSANRIAKWNGTAWSALGSGITGTGQVQVNSLSVYNGLLTAAGNFNTAGGLSANNIAAWGTVLLAPTLVSPANNSIGQSLTPTLDWNDVTGASTYEVQVSTDSLFGTTLINQTGLTSSQFTIPSSVLSNYTIYYWRARGNNGEAGMWSAVWHFTTLSSAPLPPVLVYPSNHSIGQDLSLNLVWNKSAGAVSYRIQLALDSIFTNVILDDSTIVDSLRAVTGLSPLTYYWWRVSAKSSSLEVSAYSEVYNFKTIGSPFPVTLEYPANNSVNQPTSLTFLWSKATEQLAPNSIGIGGKKKYSFQSVSSYWYELVSDTAAFTNLVRDTTLTDTLKTINGLNYSTKYYWRVKAKNQAGWGSFSAWSNMTTAPMPPALVNLTVIPGGFYDPGSGQLNMTDTLLVILVDSVTSTPVDSSRVIVDSVSFSANLSFSQAPTGNYYIYVFQRNHLAISSAYTLGVTRGSLISYDFTTDSSKTYGNNMIKLSNSPVRWGMIPGDANQDGYVDGLDQTIWMAQNGLNGYFSADFNGDTYVDGLDQTIWMVYNGNSASLPCYFSRVLRPMHMIMRRGEVNKNMSKAAPDVQKNLNK